MTTQAASWKAELFQAVPAFLPDWLQWTALGLVAAGFLVHGAIRLRRWYVRRRALGPITPIPDVPHGQGRGADYLGSYAPQQPRNDAPA